MSNFKSNTKYVQRSESINSPKNNQIPNVSATMANAVSSERRSSLAQEVEQGLFKDGSSSALNNYNITNASNVSASIGFKKQSQVTSSGGGFKGTNDTVKQTPEIYSPLWLSSNLNLPRDRATINAWCRAFYALNPFVHNAISLHSTYPISKLNIKCPNKEVEKFFNDMIEETDLMNVCVQIAQEFWLLGESFIYAELDQSRGKWSRFLIQNPDYMIVKKTAVASDPIIMMRPDEGLKKIVQSNKPSDLAQRKQLNQHIIDCVKRGDNIPLDNFHVSHLARRISPYEIRGTGLPVCIFRQLMLFDKLRECYSDDTEVLTDKGFKTIDQLTELTTSVSINPNYVNGIDLDENGKINSILTMKENFKVACVNPDTNEIEYHKPTELHMSHHEGKMLHFTGKKIDTLVSPNHKMWVKEQTNGVWGESIKRPAQDLLFKKKYYKFNSKSKYVSGEYIDNVAIYNKHIPIKLYLKVLGYIISEGCVYENSKNDRYDAVICVNQLTSSSCYKDMRQSFEAFADKLNVKCCSYIDIKGSGYSKNTPKEKWESRIHGKDLVKYFKNEIGTSGSTRSEHKHLPRWVLNLRPDLLSIVLDSLVSGDGSKSQSKYGTESKSFKYSTISKQLADDVYELVYKIGFVPNICVSVAKKSDGRIVTEYIVMWSDTDYGNEPLVYTGTKSKDGAGGGAIINEIDYNGKVWCFEVPTGLFITRRNGKLAIHGNSKFAQADGMINPLTLVKVGGGAGDYKPTHADLDAWREIFECHDEETEVLTDSGFKRFDEVIQYSEIMDGTYSYPICLAYPKNNVKIACFNPNNEELEYHTPTGASVYNYEGEMYHFSNKKVDLKVTPNHKLWVSKRENGSKYGSWHKLCADKLLINNYHKFKSHIKWTGKDIVSTNICDKSVPIENYLEYIGYLLSEGCVYKSSRNYYTSICQSTITDKKHYPKMRKCLTEFAKLLDMKTSHYINKNGIWSGKISNKGLYEYFKNEIGVGGDSTSAHKKMPKWILELSPRLLKIVLSALVCGDGNVSFSKLNKLKLCRYTTISKQLADDVYEMAYKCGYVPLLATSARGTKVYDISWSEDINGKGRTPLIHKGNSLKETNPLIIENYNGKVWCFEVPTGLFITRRNGKITIQGNSAQYDKDFKIFTHEGVSVERVGYGQGILDIGNDITQLIKEIYVGLQVPSVLMDGGSDTTYANGGVAMDILRQRYMQFRNMMSMWLKRKIFAPISHIQGFYEYKKGSGKSEKQLIVPEIDWNHMSLFDAGDYMNVLSQLTQGEGGQKRVSLHTLYRSLGLEWEDEQRKMRKEAISVAILKKEQAALDTMDLNSIRAITDDDEILEPDNASDSANESSGGETAPLPGMESSPTTPPAV